MAETLYTVHIVFHSAQNLPIADMNNLSCDPFIEATVKVAGRDSDPGDPPLTWRTPTARQTRNPTWNSHWIISGVPQSGFTLAMRVKDEDARDRDDRLGKAYFTVTAEMMRVGYETKEHPCKVMKRKGSFRPWIQTYLAGVLPGEKVMKHNRVVVSVKVVSKAADQRDQRVFTIGPNAYSQHFSPLIGSVINRKDQFAKSLPPEATGNEKKKVAASTFVANKLQLTGPPPADLRMHYVGYNKFIVLLYNKTGILGHLFNRGLRKQYRTIYSHNADTLYSIVDGPDDEVIETGGQDDNDEQVEKKAHAMAKTFLELTKWGTGSRIYTYVITLDAEWRFCETGDEFALDFLSKHMMHANGAQIVTFSGEFFVRRINSSGSEQVAESNDPKDYELVIDNNSGTYRPPKEKLPVLQNWLADKRRLGGLGRVTVMDAFDEQLQDLKKKRKEEKKRLAGGELPHHQIAVRQGSSVSSLHMPGIGKVSSREVEEAMADGAEQRRNKGERAGSQDENSVDARHTNDSGIQV